MQTRWQKEQLACVPRDVRQGCPARQKASVQKQLPPAPQHDAGRFARMGRRRWHESKRTNLSKRLATRWLRGAPHLAPPGAIVWALPDGLPWG